VFGVILAIVVTVMQGYVFWRASSVPFVKEHVPRKQLVGTGLALWASFFLCSVVSADMTGVLAAPLELWSMTWLAMLFLTSMALLAVDVSTGFGTWMKQPVPGLRGAALIAGGLLSAVALVQGLQAPVMESHEVHVARLPAAVDGTVVVGLSDLHLGTLLGPPWLAARVRQVQAERPDLVVFIDDLFEGRYDLAGLTAIVSRGAGTWWPRMRLWKPAEILRVTLRSGISSAAAP
jgi:hypothetical protein